MCSLLAPTRLVLRPTLLRPALGALNFSGRVVDAGGRQKAAPSIVEPSSSPASKLDFTSGSLSGRLFRRLFRRPPLRKVRPYAVTLFSSCAQGVDIKRFFRHFGLEDTYYSWYLVTELHVWMLSVRLMADGSPEARAVRDALIEMLWRDCEERAKLIGHMSPKERRNAICDIGDEFRMALLIYDDGLLGDDRRLANAVWRRFLDARQPPDAARLESAVDYVRRTLAALDRVDVVTLVSGGDGRTGIRWLPLVEGEDKEEAGLPEPQSP